jgi:hypothetical protein
MTRQVTFAYNIARPKARDTPSSGHPAPTSLPCQPSRFHLPAPHQANPPSAQHSATEQERAETARQSTLTVTFTARKSPVQATPRTRQPAPAARRYLFQSSFHLRPTVPSSAAAPERAKRAEALSAPRAGYAAFKANSAFTEENPFDSIKTDSPLQSYLISLVR